MTRMQWMEHLGFRIYLFDVGASFEEQFGYLDVALRSGRSEGGKVAIFGQHVDRSARIQENASNLHVASVRRLHQGPVHLLVTYLTFLVGVGVDQQPHHVQMSFKAGLRKW